MSTYRVVNVRLVLCLNSVLNVKAVVAPFNQEKALVGAFSVITNLRMDLFKALLVSPLLAAGGGGGDHILEHFLSKQHDEAEARHPAPSPS